MDFIAMVDAHSSSLNDACTRCQFAFETLEAENNAVQQGIVGSNAALDLAMENFKHGYEHFDLVSKNARHFIDARRMELQQRQHLSGLNANAVHHTVAEPAPIRPVVADVLEEYNTAAPEETVKHNIAASKETAQHNWDVPELDPNKEAWISKNLKKVWWCKNVLKKSWFCVYFLIDLFSCFLISVFLGSLLFMWDKQWWHTNTVVMWRL